MISISKLQKQVFKTAVEHGWWPQITDIADVTGERIRINLEKVNIPEKIALMHSELSEALEHFRTGNEFSIDPDKKPDGMWVELADCIIRILDLSEAYNVNMEEMLKTKHEYNKTRPYRHGNKKC